ncbi:hypothetical protein [Sediminispirochaeta smaragdinae]|uniref:Uncharacterized protein n=1 Tax=Sediminispirochaeta smaragdinae (strain DSM 11293 / JCM 15392 / SEBR 4228) TaxID=573413 RepID=E1R4M0_SEDSS|nr:hypothetical protein [Sediminispirochaeta smaragdinae]ADK81761.1 hypothetical protein Spirs_2654 [Sediminispirochaeta smaragdinae DSM 11293]
MGDNRTCYILGKLVSAEGYFRIRRDITMLVLGEKMIDEKTKDLLQLFDAGGGSVPYRFYFFDLTD